ncbi:MAG TPA: tRNA modification GTPase [Leeuwenhoekiella sp.]|nr:tRNA modification GTPase [Leeuwenhoekiella sp.]
MKRFHLFLCAFYFIFSATAQINFEKGYYIDNLDQRIDGYIKNQDWKSNPAQFEFKATENATPKTITLKYAQEFGFENRYKYIRATVKLDRSSAALQNLSKKRIPEFVTQELFLKLLVQGEAMLYRYEDGNMIRYFYSKNDTGIKPLVYKEYIEQDQDLRKNESYKQELFNNLKCSSISLNRIKKLKYKSTSLVDFFTDYNSCINPDYKNTIVKEHREFFHLSIRPGVKYANLKLERFSTIGLASRKVNLDDAWSVRAGLEAEFILPFNKNKWSILVEPTYQYYKSEGELDNETTSADYKSIELPLGVRHYFFLNDTSKLFVNAAFVLDFSLNSTITYRDRVQLDTKSRNNIALGAGFKYGDRYSFEFRYDLDRNVLSDYIYYDSDYGGFSLIFGYTIF